MEHRKLQVFVRFVQQQCKCKIRLPLLRLVILGTLFSNCSLYKTWGLYSDSDGSSEVDYGFYDDFVKRMQKLPPCDPLLMAEESLFQERGIDIWQHWNHSIGNYKAF